MKKYLFAFLLFVITFGHAQLSDSTTSGKIYIKGNALLLPVGIINAGAEFQLRKKITLQGDFLISPWKSFYGNPLQIYMAGLEGRYYFKEAFHHWYIGGNISAARYKIQKWNYRGEGNYQFTPDSPVYQSKDLYQKGYAFLLGATVGYQFQLRDRWNMDVYVGAGSSQGFYKGYHKKTGVRYDEDGGRWNKSGEFIPYRGGIMISYKI